MYGDALNVIPHDVGGDALVETGRWRYFLGLNLNGRPEEPLCVNRVRNFVLIRHWMNFV